VPLPASARRPVNYYFALGVTPRATTDQIRRFYRLKAREAHPDRHRGELTPERWNELMGLIGDAEQVLTDSLTRRAYDVHWLRRSRQLTAAYSSRAERRGDWATRLLWYVAEVSETEEHLRALMGQIARCEEPAARRGLGLDLAALTDDYESRLSGIRLQGYAVPDAFTGIAEQVRAELTRKQRMVEPLRAMAGACGDGHDLPTAALAAVTDGLDQLRLAHHRFDLRLAEDAPAALIA
jgi:curved DNA-binding protein CbpA